MAFLHFFENRVSLQARVKVSRVLDQYLGTDAFIGNIARNLHRSERAFDEVVVSRQKELVLYFSHNPDENTSFEDLELGVRRQIGPLWQKSAELFKASVIPDTKGRAFDVVVPIAEDTLVLLNISGDSIRDFCNGQAHTEATLLTQAEIFANELRVELGV